MLIIHQSETGDANDSIVDRGRDAQSLAEVTRPLGVEDVTVREVGLECPHPLVCRRALGLQRWDDGSDQDRPSHRGGLANGEKDVE
jgi:hypothetical protein